MLSVELKDVLDFRDAIMRPGVKYKDLDGALFQITPGVKGLLYIGPTELLGKVLSNPAAWREKHLLTEAE